MYFLLRFMVGAYLQKSKPGGGSGSGGGGSGGGGTSKPTHKPNLTTKPGSTHNPGSISVPIELIIGVAVVLGCSLFAICCYCSTIHLYKRSKRRKIRALVPSDNANVAQLTNPEYDSEEQEWHPSAPPNDEVDVISDTETYRYSGANNDDQNDSSKCVGELPTYDEATQIENSTQVRRRVSSQLSIKSEDFKAALDYDYGDCPAYSP